MRNGLKDGKSVGGVKAAATSLGDAGVSLAVSGVIICGVDDGVFGEADTQGGVGDPTLRSVGRG